MVCELYLNKAVTKKGGEGRDHNYFPVLLGLVTCFEQWNMGK